jgi:hypothetical protein
VPFKPLRLLLVHDAGGGLCELVVPRLAEMLRHRAFDVDVAVLGDTPPDLAAYRGVVIGCPVRGVRAGGPTEGVRRFIADADGLGEKRVGIFVVYDLRPGGVLSTMKDALLERGAEVVAEHAYWRFNRRAGEEVLPAECMVRIH